MEFRLFLGRTEQLPCGLFIERIWGVDPGQRELSPHGLYPDRCPPGHPFRIHGRTSSRVVCATCLLVWSGVPDVDVVSLIDPFCRLILSRLSSPWGLKSRDIRRWVVNQLEVPCSSIWGL